MKIKKSLLFLAITDELLTMFTSCKPTADYYTRSVGIYPGKASEDRI
jgi:hypothetical protein